MQGSAPSIAVCPSSMMGTQLWVLLKLVDSWGYFFTYIYYYLKPLLGRITEESAQTAPLDEIG